MKINLDWLSEFVTVTEKSAAKIKEVITANVAEVETMEARGEHLKNIVVGKLTELKKHPNADKLSLTRVFDGKEEWQVVCGGSNLKDGMTVALAKIGAVVKWGEEMMTIQKTKLRGEDSCGMICASDEVGLTDMFPKTKEKEIMDLTSLQLTPGTPLAEALGLSDTVLDIDNHAITNRGDLFSHRGFAREFVANGLAKWKKPKSPTLPKAGGAVPIEVEIADKEICSRYTAVSIGGLEVGDSPDWMKKRLNSCGVNPISNIVDITNYVMLELGMPLHAFDLDKLRGKKWAVRKSRKGEKVTTLDGQTHELPEGVAVIDDGHELVDLCGIMGGMASMITSDTKKIWLHAPVFHPGMVRRAMRALGHVSDAAIIYEKGVDDELTADGLARAVELILELCPQAKVESQVVDIRNRPAEKRVLDLGLANVTRLIGKDIGVTEIKRILGELGFGVTGTVKSLKVAVPSWRLNDTFREADVIEDIARVHGYNNLPYITPVKDISPIPVNKRRREERLCRERLTGLGFDEICTFAFLGPELLKKTGMDGENAIELINPLSSDLSLMRESLLPRLLETVADNLRYQKTFRLFELSRVYRKTGETHEERSTLIAALVGDSATAESGFRAMQGAMQGLSLHFSPSSSQPKPHEHPGRRSAFVFAGKTIGSLYEVHPQILKNFDIKERVIVMELDVEALHEMDLTYLPKYAEMPKFPSVQLDVSILVPRKGMAAEYGGVIQRADKLIQRVELIDEYKGTNVPTDKRALTYQITYLADDRTLTDKEVEAVHTQVLQKLKDKGAEVR